MVVVLFVAFGVVPNWLLDWTATRVTPTGRDVIVVGWWVASLIGCAWLFLRLQSRRPQSREA